MGVMDELIDGITNNPLTATGIAAGSGAIVGAGVTGLVISANSRKKRRSRKTSRKRNNRSRKTRKRKTPYTAGKRKDRSTRRIRYTKNGQPYVLTSSGRAKFIKRSSAKRSHKLKGGKY